LTARGGEQMGSGGSSAPRGGGQIAKRAPTSVPAAVIRPIKQAGKYLRIFLYITCLILYDCRKESNYC
jgi:hypothetical protein